MPKGDKSKYTDKQKRQAEHIAEGYEERGVGKKTAKARAWATVNAQDSGGKKSGSGRGKAKDMTPSKQGGRTGGTAIAKKSAKKKTSKKTSPNIKSPKRKKAERSTPQKSTKKKGAKKTGGKKKSAKKKSTKGP